MPLEQTNSMVKGLRRQYARTMNAKNAQLQPTFKDFSGSGLWNALEKEVSEVQLIEYPVQSRDENQDERLQDRRVGQCCQVVLGPEAKYCEKVWKQGGEKCR